MSRALSDAWNDLTEHARWVAREVLQRQVDLEMTHEELADLLEVDRKQIADWIEELEVELRAKGVGDEFPPLTKDEYEALRDDIAANGVRVPIIVDENGKVIDGHHRVKACRELGAECPREVRAGLDETEKHSLALGLNLVRRHLSQSQRRMLVDVELIRDATRSDRQIASAVGVSHPTVGAARRLLEARGAVVNLSTRTDALGREQAAAKPKSPTTSVGSKTLTIFVYASREERDTWKERADSEGIRLSDWLKKLANEATT